MTLDEAIRHCEEKAKEQREIAKCYVSTEYPRVRTQRRKCNKCAREHEQLAMWLKDYKRLLEWEKDIKGKVYRNEHCDRAGKCIDYIGYHCAGCNGADMRGEDK